jgi:hypothetical protein
VKLGLSVHELVFRRNTTTTPNLTEKNNLNMNFCLEKEKKPKVIIYCTNTLNPFNCVFQRTIQCRMRMTLPSPFL